MTEIVEVTINNDVFDVTVSGDVSTSARVSGIILDECRLAAADHFLTRRDLTKGQRNYWAGVRSVTPEHKRFR